MKYMYKDCEGNVVHLDKYHAHELTDRLHIMHNMWIDFIQNHPACEVLMQGQGAEVERIIGGMYQQVGCMDYEEFE